MYIGFENIYVIIIEGRGSFIFRIGFFERSGSFYRMFRGVLSIRFDRIGEVNVFDVDLEVVRMVFRDFV